MAPDHFFEARPRDKPFFKGPHTVLMETLHEEGLKGTHGVQRPHQPDEAPVLVHCGGAQGGFCKRVSPQMALRRGRGGGGWRRIAPGGQVASIDGRIPCAQDRSPLGDRDPEVFSRPPDDSESQ